MTLCGNNEASRPAGWRPLAVHTRPDRCASPQRPVCSDPTIPNVVQTGDADRQAILAEVLGRLKALL